MVPVLFFHVPIQLPQYHLLKHVFPPNLGRPSPFSESTSLFAAVSVSGFSLLPQGLSTHHVPTTLPEAWAPPQAPRPHCSSPRVLLSILLFDFAK